MTEPAYKFSRTKDEQSWPAQGEWTYEDYLRLPEDGNRYEVIRGFLYVTASPIFDHQFASNRLSTFVSIFVITADLGVVLEAPFDIKLPRGIASPVEPDLMFFRKGNEPQWGAAFFEGVPDMVTEILSPGTRRRDRTTKLSAYQDAGIPEYWLVDPETRTVVVYVLEDGKYTELVRGGIADEVWSSVLPGLRVKVAGLFQP